MHDPRWEQLESEYYLHFDPYDVEDEDEEITEEQSPDEAHIIGE